METIKKLRMCIASAKTMTHEEIEENKNAMKIRLTELAKNYNRTTYRLPPDIRQNVDQLYALLFDFYTFMGGDFDEDSLTPDVVEDHTLIPSGYQQPRTTDFNLSLFSSISKGIRPIREIFYFHVISIPRFYLAKSADKRHVTKAKIIVYTRDSEKQYFKGSCGSAAVFEKVDAVEKEAKSTLVYQHLYMVSRCRLMINDPMNPNAKYIPKDLSWEIGLSPDDITDLGPCVETTT